MDNALEDDTALIVPIGDSGVPITLDLGDWEAAVGLIPDFPDDGYGVFHGFSIELTTDDEDAFKLTESSDSSSDAIAWNTRIPLENLESELYLHATALVESSITAKIYYGSGNNTLADDSIDVSSDETCSTGSSFPIPVIRASVSDTSFVLNNTESQAPPGQQLNLMWTIDGTEIAADLDNLVFSDIDLTKLREFVNDDVVEVTLAATYQGRSCRVSSFIQFRYSDADSSDEISDSDTTLSTPTTWAEWSPAYKALNITGKKNNSRVRQILTRATSVYKLDNIPILTPGTARPKLSMIDRDASVEVEVYREGAVEVTVDRPYANNAWIARLNIRANLQALKQEIVDDVDSMLRAYPPTMGEGVPVPLSTADRQHVANVVADTHIRAVDSFLATHPGANPAQGTRNWILNQLGIQNAQNHPWCEDWAGYILSNLTFTDPKVFLSIRTHWAQWNNPNSNLQHNWVVMRSNGNSEVLGMVEPQLNGHPVIYFDPWRTLLPKVYAPGHDPNTPLTQWGVAVSDP